MPIVKRTCSADPQALWTAVSDVESWPSVLPTITSVRRLDPGKTFEKGAEFEVSQPRLRTSRYVVTDVDPGRSFTWTSRAAGVTTVAAHRIDPGVHGSVLTLEIEWSGPLAWVARLGYTRLTRRYMELEAETMERVATGAPTRSADDPK